jgi:hypothetical protein
MTTMFAQPPPAPSLSGPSGPTLIQTPTSPQPYTSQAQLTPPSSSETIPHVASPISPRTSWNVPQHLQMQTRQIRQPKGPMYVPAVLRPTEKPVRQSPPKYGSPESFDESSGAERPAGIVPGLSRIVTEEWNEEIMGAVTGAPSRNHWKVRKHLIHNIHRLLRHNFGHEHIAISAARRRIWIVGIERPSTPANQTTVHNNFKEV